MSNDREFFCIKELVDVLWLLYSSSDLAAKEKFMSELFPKEALKNDIPVDSWFKLLEIAHDRNTNRYPVLLFKVNNDDSRELRATKKLVNKDLRIYFDDPCFQIERAIFLKIYHGPRRYADYDQFFEYHSKWFASKDGPKDFERKDSFNEMLMISFNGTEFPLETFCAKIQCQLLDWLNLFFYKDQNALISKLETMSRNSQRLKNFDHTYSHDEIKTKLSNIAFYSKPYNYIDVKNLILYLPNFSLEFGFARWMEQNRGTDTFLDRFLTCLDVTMLRMTCKGLSKKIEALFSFKFPKNFDPSIGSKMRIFSSGGLVVQE